MNDVFIGPGDLEGKGVFASRDFEKGEIVIKYKLRRLTKIGYTKLKKNEKKFVHRHGLNFYLYSSPERYVNHSSKPNTVQDLKKGCDIAIRKVRKGEQITTNSTKDDTS